jgi:hypothetical protein
MSVTRGRCARCDYIRRTCTNGTMAVHAPRVDGVKGDGVCPGSRRPPAAGPGPSDRRASKNPSGPTAPCPVCLVPTVTRQDGTMRAHGWSASDMGARCPGSGALPTHRFRGGRP